MKSRLHSPRRVLTILGFGAVIVIATILVVPQLRWRTHLLLLHLSGAIPDIEFKQTLVYMLPGTEQRIEPLRRMPNPYEVIRNPKRTEADVRAGHALFQNHGCSQCHGADASGGPGGPALNTGNFRSGGSDWAVYRTIRRGVPNTAMPPHDLPDSDLWQLISFLRYLEPSSDAAALSKVGPKLEVHVSYQEIAAVREPGEDWLTFSGSYVSWRHSALQQITTANVGQLALKWIRPISNSGAGIEATPLVRKGTMFLTALPSRVLALNAVTGEPIWEYEHKIVAQAAQGELQPFNRGVALLNDKVFFGTRDAKLIALSASNGALQWERSLSPDPDRYFVSGAPLALKDFVVVGVGVREGGRGFIAAYDAQTGAERWRFTSIPGPGEPGHGTWSGESWRLGGGPMWMTGSYDAEQDLIIWGVGNPKPDYDNSVRKGDNLYTNSVVAIRGETGQLVWHFQFTPGDDHDWDSAQVPVLIDDKDGGKRVLWGNRNGFYYVLDRTTGKFITGVPFMPQNWAAGLDPNGRPRLLVDSLRKRTGSFVYPGNMGGTNWWPPTYDPALNLFFLPSLDQGMVFFASNESWPHTTSQTFHTSVQALDALTGTRRWEYKHSPRLTTNKTGGLLSTRTGLLFGGDLTTFFALDSRTGNRLWAVEAGALIMAAPVTYSVDGRQFVAIAAGANLLSFGLPE